MATEYSIGQIEFPGFGKLIEETGELNQVIGKIIGAGHMGQHFDGSQLLPRLEEEIADVQAALWFTIAMNGLRRDKINARMREKIKLFCAWHMEGLDGK